MNIGPNLANNILQPSNLTFQDFLKTKPHVSFHIKHTVVKDVHVEGN